MKQKDALLLFLVALAVSLLAAWLQPVPGYMDAEYYYGGAIRLVEGKGWNEIIIWNYLDNPINLPHPAHIYWMPMASFLAVPGMWLFQTHHFFAARLLMIILAALIPILTAQISYRLSNKKSYAILSALLALFSGYYLIYTTNIETFTPYMLLGGLYILIILNFSKPISLTHVFALGVISGAMHLARADGVLWLLATFGIVTWEAVENWTRVKQTVLIWVGGRVVILILGYVIIMSPWYFRNILVLGHLFPSGISRALWITDYNQLFSYPADTLNFQNWMGSGWMSILSTRWQSLLENLKTLLGVQTEIFLLPLILLGALKFRKQKGVLLGLVMEGVTFLMMSIVFPFAGWRGGFLHSGAALQPLFWALVPIGLDRFVQWGVKNRKWHRQNAFRAFSTGLILLSIGFTAYIYEQRVIGPEFNDPIWMSSYNQAKLIEEKLLLLGATKEDVILINNPPGYYAANGRSAIVTPNGGIQTILEVSQKFHVSYLVLEKDHVAGLDDLYQNPRDVAGLDYIDHFNDVRLFKVRP